MEAEVRPEAKAEAASTEEQLSTTSVQSTTTTEALYNSFSAYPFSADDEFQAGLASILGHPETPATQAELEEKSDLVLKAQTFYYARKYNTPRIDPSTYQKWLQKGTSTINLNHETDPTSLQAKPDPDSSRSQSQTQPQPQPPPYPTSFAAIVDLITNNKPIPGIQEIPDTILEHGSSKTDKVSRRRKPWEKDQPEQPVITTLSVASTGENVDKPAEHTEWVRKTGEGVMHILSPSAVPDSGLIGKE